MDLRGCRAKYRALAPTLTERSRRVWAATEARAVGRGGMALVARATGISPSTIARGLRELRARVRMAAGRVRRPGGGRKRTIDQDPTLRPDLEGLVEPTASGDPESALRWTAKSTRHLARTLRSLGHRVSHQLVAELLTAAGYSLQANRKTREGPPHPDRDAQFRHILTQVRHFQAAGQPVISVDTKKKELVGDFKNAGRVWRPTGQPERVRVHDFLIPARGKAVPYGVYDLTRNAGWVSVGINHDTASFAVRTIGRWWQKMGRPRYPRARSLLITADAGGQQRPPGPPLEVGAAAIGHPHRPHHHDLSLSPGDQQVALDRASALLVHQSQLARAAAGESGRDREPDQRHPNAHRTAGAVRTGSRDLSERPYDL